MPACMRVLSGLLSMTTHNSNWAFQALSYQQLKQARNFFSHKQEQTPKPAVSHTIW